MLYVALDSTFLIVLGQRADKAQESIAKILELRGHAVVTPCVLQELRDMVENAVDANDKALAEETIENLLEWQISAPTFEGIKLDLSRIVARRLTENGICATYESALVLGEAAALDCPLLLTYESFVGSDQLTNLKLALLQSDLQDCLPVHPIIFTEFFRDQGPLV